PRFANYAAERITGSTASELIGQPVVQILSFWPDLTEQHKEIMETQSEVALGEGEDKRYYDLRISPLYDQHGSVTGRVITLHDITERKQQEELQRKIFENVQVGIFVVQEGKFKYVNPEFEYHSGYTQEELLENPSLNLVHPEDREKVRENAIRMLKGEKTQAYEYRAVGKNGQITWIMEKVTSIEYRKERATLGSYIDITARKQEEERRARFITMLTHELCTPLTPVLSSGNLLVEQLEAKGGDESRLARNILEGAHSLNDRLNELLELAKGETGRLKVNLIPLEPERLIRRLTSECSGMFAAKKQEFHLELEELLPDVLADEQHTSQVLLNLLSGANKFTPEGGQVSLRAKAEENALVIEIEDTSPGIPLEEQRGIFQPYSHSDKFSGLAFGLVISRQLIELQGGNIWCRSQPGKGSTFGFSLPLAAKEPSQE
ncbi:MAG: PAS domain S-box protein, partial [Chloroflexota bacterium]|nr:PAS domain S-box protein [Chloroflexota bacterium]